jgi:hypothetical protein
MDPLTVKRSKKSDKAKRNFDRNGTKTMKHVRTVEYLIEKRQQENSNMKTL